MPCRRPRSRREKKQRPRLGRRLMGCRQTFGQSLPVTRGSCVSSIFHSTRMTAPVTLRALESNQAFPTHPQAFTPTRDPHLDPSTSNHKEQPQEQPSPPTDHNTYSRWQTPSAPGRGSCRLLNSAVVHKIFEGLAHVGVFSLPLGTSCRHCPSYM